MDKERIRGREPDDDRVFTHENQEIMRRAQQELRFLLDRGYPQKSAMTFIGNHHQLTSRQSLAVMRSTASTENLKKRDNKRLHPSHLAGQTLYIDGFNQIITLEVALTGGVLLNGLDGCVRDLAELRGTYRLIPSTETAIEIIKDISYRLEVSRIVIMLDEPVSNSGRLKTNIYGRVWPMPVDVNILRSPDVELKKLSCVVTSDSVILDNCISWFNMTVYALKVCSEFKEFPRIVWLDSKASVLLED